ncbi:leucyl aminopeptidase [Candidatus Woesearchaeota archaeon]|nr:leucyl aminopeptidase [Candidatus Woesearchaeota archaeon]
MRLVTQQKPSFAKQATVILITKTQWEKQALPRECKAMILDAAKKVQFTSDEKQVLTCFVQKGIILLFGLGSECTPEKLRGHVKAALQAPELEKLSTIEVVLHNQDDPTIRAAVDGIMIGLYKWEKYVSEKKTVEKAVSLITSKDIRRYVTINEGVNYSRSLINENADLATALVIEQHVRALIKGHRNVSIEVLTEKEMKKHGLGLHLAVNKGSKNPPRLLIVAYKGGKGAYTALVGKGITYDTGGLNLKPTGYMETMRDDKSGACSVLATLKNVLAFQPKRNILFVMALAENAIGSSSYKPGDVLTSFTGKTVEVGNTDAEGRLVLADAVAYTEKKYDVVNIITIATLTGACIVALGYEYSGLMANDRKLADALLKASQITDDRVWQLPIYDELKEHVKSDYADIKNVGLPKGVAGALSAAEFIRQFVKKAKWAHLDIAGPAFAETKRQYYEYGATGVPVRLLTEFVCS